MSARVNEWDDSVGAPAPCIPIGCDNGYHLPGCFYGGLDDEGEVRGYDEPPLNVIDVIPGGELL